MANFTNGCQNSESSIASEAVRGLSCWMDVNNFALFGGLELLGSRAAAVCPR